MTVLRYKTPPGRGSSVAPIPIQRTIFSGSVKNWKTVSCAASIRISRKARGRAAGFLMESGFEPIRDGRAQKRGRLLEHGEMTGVGDEHCGLVG